MIVEKLGRSVCLDLNWLKIGFTDEFCEHRNETMGSV
jgi:hypothetical protein